MFKWTIKEFLLGLGRGIGLGIGGVRGRGLSLGLCIRSLGIAGRGLGWVGRCGCSRCRGRTRGHRMTLGLWDVNVHGLRVSTVSYLFQRLGGGSGTRRDQRLRHWF